MNDAAIKAILQAIVQQIDDLRVNEAVLLAKTNGSQTLGSLLDIRKAAENSTKSELASLRQQIAELA